MVEIFASKNYDKYRCMHQALIFLTLNSVLSKMLNGSLKKNYEILFTVIYLWCLKEKLI